jgi:hypothetical protein
MDMKSTTSTEPGRTAVLVVADGIPAGVLGIIVTARRQARAIHYVLTDDHIAHIVLDAIRHAQE